MVKPAPEAERCIAHVPQRTSGGLIYPPHRCLYRARAEMFAGIKVCNIHAGLRRKRKPKVPTDQLPLFSGNAETIMERKVDDVPF